MASCGFVDPSLPFASLVVGQSSFPSGSVTLPTATAVGAVNVGAPIAFPNCSANPSAVFTAVGDCGGTPTPSSRQFGLTVTGAGTADATVQIRALVQGTATTAASTVDYRFLSA